MTEYFQQFWQITLELSPWLLFGLLLAGMIHILMPIGVIQRQLGGHGLLSILKAVAFGIPLPLCSCGVIPATLGLKREGASDGAAMGFLVSTPQTGVDSILVSAAFLGWPFAIFKVGAALVSGMTAGVLTSLFGAKAAPAPAANHSSCCAHQAPEPSCCAEKPAPSCCAEQQPASCHSNTDNGNNSRFGHSRFRELIRFSVVELMGDIWFWLFIGIAAAALITVLVPPDGLADKAWAQGLPGMLAMLALSVPMYACSTASVPLVAILVTRGLSPGAALVFLMAGPTTNVATIGMAYRTFGVKGSAIYLLTVIGISLIAGVAFNQLLGQAGAASHMHHLLPHWLHVASAWLITVLVVGHAARRIGRYFATPTA